MTIKELYECAKIQHTEGKPIIFSMIPSRNLEIELCVKDFIFEHDRIVISFDQILSDGTKIHRASDETDSFTYKDYRVDSVRDHYEILYEQETVILPTKEDAIAFIDEVSEYTL